VAVYLQKVAEDVYVFSENFLLNIYRESKTADGLLILEKRITKVVSEFVGYVTDAKNLKIHSIN
jgi:hypothetical protein